jgi:pyruvate dehydrogenase E2 component (dihydrolipoamide acetyltransferase)
MYDITMPKLSDSMEEGKIIAWRVKEGDEVEEGQVLAEVESDKATMELECFHSGTLAEITHGDGSEVRVGEVIGRIAPQDESAKKEEPKAKSVPEKKAEEKPEKKEAEKEEKKPVLKEEKKPEKGPVSKEEEEPRGEGERIAISPYARKLAKARGIDVSKLKGTGPDGRIVAHDVEQAALGPGAPAKPSSAPKPSPDEELPPLDATEDEADIEDAPYRLKTQARRVVASKHVIPHFYVTRGIDVTGLFSRKDALKEKYGATITHIVLLAALKALKEQPDANRSYDRGRVFKWKGIHLGLAVETDDGLTVVVLRDAQNMGLKEIVKRSGELVEKARSGKLSAEDRRHPTFTVSSLGMFDVEQFEPIINPPSAMTLAVASALEAPVVRDGKLEVGRVMKLTLSCDHRIIDGVGAAKFMAALKAKLEDVEGLVG